MTHTVIISDRASAMLEAHIRFLAEISPPAAENVKTALIGAMRSLSVMPGRYPFFDEAHIPANKYRRMFVKNWYLVLYQIQDDHVFVEYIVDCRQDCGWLID